MSIWRGKDPLILASQSRARQTLLANAGIAFEAMPADIDERAVQHASGLSAPGEIAALLAREEGACRIVAPCRGRFVVGADQTLALGAAAVSASPPAARRRPSNCAHWPATAMNFIPPLPWRATARYCSKTVGVARMTMRRLGDGEIEAYLDEAGEAVTTSVGAYQLEGLGMHLFERIDGDHFTILGLPLLPLLAFLRSERLLAV